jgi:homoserine O-acetyltransferase/O-succinyltransferase
MRIIIVLLLAFVAAAQPPPQQFAQIGDLRLESGEVIRDCRIGYRTIGTLNADRSNAILFPTWFLGDSAQIAGLVGPGRLVDPARWHVIIVDALGNGVSTSPSNSKLQPRMRFPRFTIRDMVNSQHILLTKHLGIHRLRAVMGSSMGGMQAFEWIVGYPDFVEMAVPLVGTPQQTAFDLLFWSTEQKAIELDPAWKKGEYRRPPERAMRTVAAIHALAVTTPQHRNRLTPREKFPEYLAQLEKTALERFDANNWIRQVQAMMDHDIARHWGGDLAEAARRVRARAYIIVGLQDLMVNPQPALAFAPMIQAHTLELHSDCGHQAVGCEMEKVSPRIGRFLEGLPPEDGP